MARHDPRVYPIPDLKDSNKLKEFLRLKYLEKRFYEVREAPVEQPKPEIKSSKTLNSGFINLLEDEPSNNPSKLQKPVENHPVLSPLNPPNNPNFFQANFPPANSNPAPISSQLFPAISNSPAVTPNQFNPNNPPQIPNPVQSPPIHQSPQLFSQINPSNTSTVSNSFGLFNTFNPTSYNPGFPPNPQPAHNPVNPIYNSAYNPSPAYPQSFQPSFQNFPSQNLPSGGFQFPPSFQYNYSNPQSLSPPIPPNGQQTFFPKSVDPFDQIFEEEREKKLLQQNRSHISPAQNLMLQQFNVQAQVYQKTYGVPYPYTFQQWLALNNQPLQSEPRTNSKNPFDLFT